MNPSKRILFISFALFFWFVRAQADDLSSLGGKHIVGYQGWFGCPSDPMNPRWSYWSKSSPAAGLAVDLWPDLAEFQQSELCPTGLTLSSGAPAFVFSSENADTVRRHFRWMRDYGIDGAAVERFVSKIADLLQARRTNKVLDNVRLAAEAEGRGFFVMYDVSGADPARLLDVIKDDWTSLARQGIAASPSYMHHRGKPVVAVWGLGFTDRKVDAVQAAAIIRFLKEAGVTVLGGVPAAWRILARDSRQEPEWADVYRSFDILSPWTVGRYRNETEAAAFGRNMMAPDIAQARKNGQDYMPVIFPGFSWHNSRDGAAPLDQIPRLCGKFYQAQVKSALKSGANMLFTAMFDEVNEGTAIFKLEQSPDHLPQGAMLLIPDGGQCRAGSDLYLRLAGEASKAVRAGAGLSKQP
jgi:hypothetical protein